MATLDSERCFSRARIELAGLEHFGNAGDLTLFLNSPDGDLDEKDRIYGVLVRAAQGTGPWGDLPTVLLWLGLWPRLDGLYRQHLRFFVGASDDLVSELSDLFTAAVARADLSRIHRPAATLLLNVRRDLRRRLRRAWDEERRLSALPDDDALDTDGVDPGPWACDPSPGDDGAALRAWLDKVVGRDAPLLERVFVYGDSQKEAGARFGLSHAAARKRFKRAVEQLSHSESRNGVLQEKGARRR